MFNLRPVVKNTDAPDCKDCENYLKLQWPPICIACEATKARNGYKKKGSYV